ncbi:hypothetical protein DOTSEDRAFT_29723 [Dothistroma septosporum NZE10]|uniref:RING-type domain-containing protein n=1 Tax=Dothistroma septosporum (strain NZE10 / CBS 128990) TaxID=675120 RepID=M2XZN0_DOTSN|nr:hypothetical protein DOTSEDRAFT_29723 [Dothistroma septosporum NZE10]
MDFSSDFPLGREYLLGNTAVLIKTPMVASWDEFLARCVMMTEDPECDDNGTVEDCSICFDVLDPGRSQYHWLSSGNVRIDGLVLKTGKCQHVFHAGCFLESIQMNPSCPICRMPMVNTAEEIVRAEAVAEALDRMSVGEYETTVGLTELPIEIRGRGLATCCVTAAHHLRIMGIGGPTPDREHQYTPSGVADHIDGRRIVESLLQAVGRRHERMCYIEHLIEQLPCRAATILRAQHSDVAYTYGMWRFSSDVAKLGVVCYARTYGMWSKDE